MHRIRDALDALPDFGIDFWVDKDDLAPGQFLDEEIEKGVFESDLALLLISSSFRRSSYIREKELPFIRQAQAREADGAEQGALRLVYVTIDDEVREPDGKEAKLQLRKPALNFDPMETEGLNTVLLWSTAEIEVLDADSNLFIIRQRPKA